MPPFKVKKALRNQTSVSACRVATDRQQCVFLLVWRRSNFADKADGMRYGYYENCSYKWEDKQLKNTRAIQS